MNKSRLWARPDNHLANRTQEFSNVSMMNQISFLIVVQAVLGHVWSSEGKKIIILSYNLQNTGEFQESSMTLVCVRECQNSIS